MVKITHYHVKEFGWESTIYQPEDFDELDLLGKTVHGEYVFTGIHDGNHHILKGYYE